MTRAFTGMVAGTALAFAGVFGGFGAFFAVAVLGSAGWAAGHWMDGGGRLRDIRDAVERGRR
ncbi:hypothetical protein ACWDUX_04785 [Streptomyces sp. NPDC003444]|uniref:hypothetical protein n=1 Tax=unclassified Streptomyces TaxID=2593676 RepID=UPI000EF85414